MLRQSSHSELLLSTCQTRACTCRKLLFGNSICQIGVCIVLIQLKFVSLTAWAVIVQCWLWNLSMISRLVVLKFLSSRLNKLVLFIKQYLGMRIIATAYSVAYRVKGVSTVARWLTQIVQYKPFSLVLCKIPLSCSQCRGLFTQCVKSDQFYTAV